MTREEMMKMLADEYGIRSEQELLQAVSKMERVNVGILTTNCETPESHKSEVGTDSSVFQDIKTGLEQAIEYNKGNVDARETTVVLPSLRSKRSAKK